MRLATAWGNSAEGACSLVVKAKESKVEMTKWSITMLCIRRVVVSFRIIP